MTHAEFVQKFPEMRDFPEFAVGANNELKRFMDFTLIDLRAYQFRLEAKIARRERIDRIRDRRARR